MQHFKAFKVFSLILGFALVTFGCATGKNQVSDFSVIAKGTSEGIELSFSNIPKDTYSLYISFSDITTNSQKTDISDTNIYIWDNDASKNELTKLRQSGNLLCPFVKNGHEYSITVTVYTVKDFENNFDIIRDFLTYSTNAIAGGGIYLTNNPALNFTDENTTVTLSEMPMFSEKVVYSPDGLFEFNNFVLMDDGNSYGGGISHWNELIYPVRQVLSGTQEHFGFTGDFPVNAYVYSCLLDGNLEWSVIVAKAKEKAIMSF